MKWIKKFLSLFIENVTEGTSLPFGISYCKNIKVYLVLPLFVNRYGIYENSIGMEIKEGERWLVLFLRIIPRIRIKFFWMPIGKQKLIW